MVMFKTIRPLSSVYQRNLFSNRSTPYNVIDSELKLDLPKTPTNYCKRGFGYCGALL